MSTNPTGRPSIVAAIIVRDRKVLMVRRRVEEDTISWQFPAGESEADETPEQTATRETREEVGLDVTADRILGQRIHPASGRHMVYVACHVASGTARVVDTEELDAVEWCGLSQLKVNVPTGIFPPVEEYLTTVLEP